MKRISHALIFSLIISIFVGRTVITAKASTVVTPDTTSAPAQTSAVIRASEHTYGPTTATVTFVVFNDTECPFCQKMHLALRSLQLDYSGDVRLIFRHYPLPMHKFAYKEAKALECVEQIKPTKVDYESAFWNYADTIMTSAQELKTHVNYRRPDSEERPRHMRWLMLTARTPIIGVSSTKLSKCVSYNQTAAKVDADIAEGNALGISGTPTTFVYKNGEFQYRLEGMYSYEALEKMTSELLGHPTVE